MSGMIAYANTHPTAKISAVVNANRTHTDA